MNTIAIIPARGNSKRLPHKNVKLLGGIPLLVHSIQYAKENGIQKIVVSTDNEEIKTIALQYGADVVDRPSHLAGDEATTVSALKHVLESLEENFENVVLFQATNPLRPKKLFEEAFEKFNEGGYDSLMTVTRNEQKFGKIVNNQFVPFNYKIGQRSQDLEPLYFENGLLYITKATLILEGKIVGDHNYSFIVNHPFAKVDVDTIEDMEYAAYICQRYIE